MDRMEEACENLTLKLEDIEGDQDAEGNTDDNYNRLETALSIR